MKKKKIHRGQILQQAATSSGLAIKDIAAKAGYSRAAYYLHIKEPDLSFEVLRQYGMAMKYDFTDDLPEMPSYPVLQEHTIPYTSESELRQTAEYWKGRYYELLEKYNSLLEQRKG